MLLVLTCALCSAQPTLVATVPDGGLVDQRLSVDERPLPALEVPPALQMDPLGQIGTGGDGHADHMTTMLIVMGVVMAVMMIGAGVYLMNHGGTRLQPSASTTALSPAQLALPAANALPRGG